jgi:hypothetical protein
MSIPFWANNPFILFDKEYIFELFPQPNMTQSQKLNSISRLILFITILGYIFTASARLVMMCAVTLFIIFILHQSQQRRNVEGFKASSKTKVNIAGTSETKPLPQFLRENFKEGTKQNPFSNVLLTDIMDDPNRKSAPPSFNVDVDDNINTNIKNSVQLMNPEIDNTNKQLFGDLTGNFDLDQSNRAFFSTANTKVVNDQGAFANFLYSDLKYSSKDSTSEGAIARVQDSYRYTLY